MGHVSRNDGQPEIGEERRVGQGPDALHNRSFRFFRQKNDSSQFPSGQTSERCQLGNIPGPTKSPGETSEIRENRWEFARSDKDPGAGTGSAVHGAARKIRKDERNSGQVTRQTGQLRGTSGQDERVLRLPPTTGRYPLSAGGHSALSHWPRPRALPAGCAGGRLVFDVFLIIACLVKTRERFTVIGQVMTMPMFFAGNAIDPLAMMPLWHKAVACCNPLASQLDALRSLMLADGVSEVGLATDFAVRIVGAWLYPRLAQQPSDRHGSPRIVAAAIPCGAMDGVSATARYPNGAT